MSPRASARPRLFSNTGRILLAIAAEQDHRTRHLARVVGLDERNVAEHLAHLVRAGAVRKRHEGRVNTYTLNVEWVDEDTGLRVADIVSGLTGRE